MTRRGVALLGALWFLVVASAVAMALLARGRTGLQATTNRLALLRGRWAAESCLAILNDNYHQGTVLKSIVRTDLGGQRWCRADVEDVGARLSLNSADAVQLSALFGSDSIAAAILDWIDEDDIARPLGAERANYASSGRPLPRNAPLPAVEALLDVRGVTPELARSVEPFVTTRGSGRVAVNAAPAEVLALLPGMTLSYARAIVDDRRKERYLQSVEELIMRAPAGTRVALSDAYGELRAKVSLAPESYIVRLIGGDGTGPEADMVATLVPVGRRLALVRKEVW